MGKRFLILIGAAALGAAVIAVVASADSRSVDDPRGDTRCIHEHGNRPCTDVRRDADIVRATAGHEGGRLRHMIRVVGKVQRGALVINTDSDRNCERILYFLRGRGRSGEVLECTRHLTPTGRARMDFHRHSVEIFFSERSIGNPRGYGWSASTNAGPHAGHAYDQVPKGRGRYIRHRLGQTAAVLASHTVKIDSRVTMPPPERRPFYGRVKSSKHACEVHRLVKVYRVTPGRDHVADGGDAKDRTNQRGKWRDAQYILQEGRYYAKVLRREVGTAGTTFVCRPDRSPTRHVQRQG